MENINYFYFSEKAVDHIVPKRWNLQKHYVLVNSTEYLNSYAIKELGLFFLCHLFLHKSTWSAYF